jgi:hypothetical protein
MSARRVSLILGFIIASVAFALMFGVLARADESDQFIIMAFSAPIEIPGNKVFGASLGPRAKLTSGGGA